MDDYDAAVMRNLQTALARVTAERDAARTGYQHMTKQRDRFKKALEEIAGFEHGGTESQRIARMALEHREGT